MAKLSAYGGIIRFRASREKHTPDGELTIWERETYAVRVESDRRFSLLKKLDVRFKPDRYEPDGRYHSYGWNVARKYLLKPTADINAFLTRWRDKFTANGWEVISG